MFFLYLFSLRIKIYNLFCVFPNFPTQTTDLYYWLLFTTTFVKSLRICKLLLWSLNNSQTAFKVRHHQRPPDFFGHKLPLLTETFRLINWFDPTRYSLIALCLLFSSTLFTDFILCFQAKNGGIVMVSFYNQFVKCGPKATVADVAGRPNFKFLEILTFYKTPYGGIHLKDFHNL